MNGPPGVLTLSDGRHLRYEDIGARDGLPVVSCHGGLSSRLDIVPAAQTAAALGVRILAPDRPGIGASDRQPGRTILDWPTDVAALADHLGLERFAMLGWSAGGTYAMACAAALSDRVTALGLVASVVPPDWPGMRRDINRMDRTFMALSHALAPVERGMLAALRGYARRRPGSVARRSGAPADVAADLGAAISEGLTDTSGAVQEYRLLNQPWGFDPSAITVATTIWQGARLTPWFHRSGPTGWRPPFPARNSSSSTARRTSSGTTVGTTSFAPWSDDLKSVPSGIRVPSPNKEQVRHHYSVRCTIPAGVRGRCQQ